MGLGLIAGITLTHRHQVSEMVARGSSGLPGHTPEPTAAAPPPAAPGAEPAATLAVADAPEPPPHTAHQPPRTQREDALLELLAEMRKEQKRMYKQLAEQNREISELTFRVDTHSDSFKPLRTDSERPRSLDASSGLQVPIGEDDNILPPRPASGP